MTTHTPGPWRAEPASTGFRRPTEYEAKDMQIVAANGICPGIVWAFMAEGKANAALIAAAPELLAALRYCDDCGFLEAHPDDSEHDLDQKSQAHRAISKAEAA